jgi:hypothetical protein
VVPACRDRDPVYSVVYDHGVSTRVPGGGVTRNPFGPSWVGGQEGAGSVGEQVQDSLFGRPKPRLLDPDDADCAHLLARLHPFRKRLARLAGDDPEDYALRLAEGTIASIDKDGQIYVGKTFLLSWSGALDVQVGVLAHEIGHRPRRWAEYHAQLPETRGEVEDLCRLEETRADYFAGYALAQLGRPCAPLCAFLAQIQIHPHPEYFSAELRAKTIHEAHASGLRKKRNVRKFFPELARMTSALGDLGEG